MSRRSNALAAALAGLLAIALAGCPGDQYDPETWVKKLESGDGEEAKLAFQRLVQLKNPAAIEPLGKFWEKHNYPSTVLRGIITLAGHEKPLAIDGSELEGPNWEPAVPYLRQAVENLDIGNQSSIEDTATAAQALGEAAEAGIKDNESITALVNVVKKKMPKLSPGQRARMAAVQALGKFGDKPQIVTTLVQVLEADDNQQPLKVAAAAANSLGETGSSQALQPMLIALYEKPAIYQQARRALTSIGQPVVPELIKVFTGKHQALEKFAKDNKFDEVAPGNLQFKAATLLGDFRATKAVPVLAEALGEPSKTSFFNPQTGEPGPPTHSAILDALSKIGGPKAEEALYDYMVSDKTDDAVRPLAIDKYSMVGTGDKALSWLAKQFSDDGQEEQIRLAAGIAYGRLANSKDDLKPLDKMIDKFESAAKKEDKKAGKGKADSPAAIQAQAQGDAYRAYAATFQENKWRAEVGVKCKQNVDCYVEFLKADDIAVGKPGLPKAERALLSLAKMGDKASGALDALLDHADKTDRVVREGVLLAMTRVAPKPCPKCVERLDQVVTKQADQTTLDALTAESRIVRNYFEAAK